MFDLDDIDAAFEELDARYLAGEAAAHAHTWSVIAEAYAAFNRHELPATTPDWVNIDHRRAIAFAPGDLTAYIRAAWDIAPDFSIYIEAVHRLSDLGAVVTQAAHGTSQEGFDAEWRKITLLTVDGDLINRCELFDEADLDAALARFDELSRPTPRLENAASRVDDRFEIAFAARDLDAMAEMMADDMFVDDRRRVVNAGLRRGRDTEIANMRAISRARGTRSDVRPSSRPAGSASPSVVIASRAETSGPRRSTPRCSASSRSTTTSGSSARVSFDPDDIDAAFEELDARYLAGEAAAHAHTWSVIARPTPHSTDANSLRRRRTG